MLVKKYFVWSSRAGFGVISARQTHRNATTEARRISSSGSSIQKGGTLIRTKPLGWRMKENIINITTDDGSVDTFVTHPSEGGQFPPVFIFMDVWGLREELFDVARRVATVGYFCVVPNLYYRQGRVRNEYRNAK